METKHIDDATKRIAELLKKNLKSEVRRKAYKTGALHDSITSIVKYVTVGPVIGIEGLDYAVFVNDGTKYIQPPRAFIEKAYAMTEDDVLELLGKAAVEDVMDELDKTFD